MATRNSTLAALRKRAAGLPATEEGVACAGTSLEAITLNTNGKAFLFLRPTEARLKLRESLPEAARFEAADPSRYRVGSGGWVRVTLDDAKDALPTLEAWIAESHRLFARAEGGRAPPRSARPAKPAKRTRQ